MPGVLHTHRGLGVMTQTLTEAWGWQASDRILHALPLHHVHGLGNALLCPLMAGACIEFLPRFSPTAVWAALQVCKALVPSPCSHCGHGSMY